MKTPTTQIRFADTTGRFVAVRESRGYWTVRSVTKMYGETYTSKTAALAGLAAMSARNPVESVGAARLRVARSIAANRGGAKVGR